MRQLFITMLLVLVSACDTQTPPPVSQHTAATETGLPAGFTAAGETIRA